MNIYMFKLQASLVDLILPNTLPNKRKQACLGPLPSFTLQNALHSSRIDKMAHDMPLRHRRSQLHRLLKMCQQQTGYSQATRGVEVRGRRVRRRSWLQLHELQRICRYIPLLSSSCWQLQTSIGLFAKTTTFRSLPRPGWRQLRSLRLCQCSPSLFGIAHFNYSNVVRRTVSQRTQRKHGTLTPRGKWNHCIIFRVSFRFKVPMPFK